jgi:hypothetical protein
MTALLLLAAILGQSGSPFLIPPPGSPGAVNGNGTVSGTETVTGLLTANGGLTLAAQHTTVTPYTASSGTTTATISAANGNSQTLTLAAATGPVTVTISGFTAGDTFNVAILQHASAPVAISSWDGGTIKVAWGNGVLPTITATNSAVDLISCRVYTSILAICSVAAQAVADGG